MTPRLPHNPDAVWTRAQRPPSRPTASTQARRWMDGIHIEAIAEDFYRDELLEKDKPLWSPPNNTTAWQDLVKWYLPQDYWRTIKNKLSNRMAERLEQLFLSDCPSWPSGL